MKRRYAWILGAIAGAGVVLRLILVFTTYGADEVHVFLNFGRLVAQYGIYGIYRIHTEIVYNHAPAVGWLLAGLNHIGISFPVKFRMISVVADLASTLLLFRIVSERFDARRGLVAAALVALNPVSIFISGFHGSVDALAFFFALLAFYLAKDRPAFSGVVLALALGTRIVTIVTLPILLIYVVRQGHFKRFALGFVGISALVWAPGLPYLSAVTPHVLSYTGGKNRAVAWSASLLAIGAGVFVSWKHDIYKSAAAAILILLLLSPAWGVYYLAWPVAFGAASMLEIPAALHAVVGGAFLFETYTRWSDGFPWHRAFGKRLLDSTGQRLLDVTWVVVIVWIAAIVLTGSVFWSGAERSMRTNRNSREPDG